VLTRRKKESAIVEMEAVEIWATYKFGPHFIMHRKKFASPSYIQGKEETYCVNGYPYKIENGLMIRTTFNYHSEIVLHSDPEPAVLYPNGTKEWYYFGKLHRLNLPAVEYANGDKEWWDRGVRHRIGGPAVIIGNKQYWYKDGEFVKCTR
ncbi:MAG: hypothetical protein WCG45_04080, partial [bacterium]